MYKFGYNILRDQIFKLRLVIQKGLEIIRLGGVYGVLVVFIIYLVKIFDERVSKGVSLQECRFMYVKYYLFYC